jgi:damage-control phosphatase, subfamily II, stand-alone protein
VCAGMLPFARELVKGGTEVVLAANEVPSINDITARELRPLLQRAGEGDAVIGRAVAEGVLRCVSSGSADPVIHLGQVSGGGASLPTCMPSSLHEEDCWEPVRTFAKFGVKRSCG